MLNGTRRGASGETMLCGIWGMGRRRGSLQPRGIELQGLDFVGRALRRQLLSVEGEIQAADVARLDHDFALSLDGLLCAGREHLMGDIFAIGRHIYPGRIVGLDQKEQRSRSSRSRWLDLG